jgi:hypothetical protein
MVSKYDTSSYDFLEKMKIHNESLRVAEELMGKFKTFAASQSVNDDVFFALDELIDNFLDNID